MTKDQVDLIFFHRIENEIYENLVKKFLEKQTVKIVLCDAYYLM